ncbi:MAG: globin [Bacilli bacterium]
MKEGSKQLNESVYNLIGGEAAVKKLVESFYDRVANDPQLSLIFPTDFTETKRKQTQFLTQFLGGPTHYSDEHGHPMLRRRHIAFPITPVLAERWLQCMKDSVEELDVDQFTKTWLMERFTQTAYHMVNTND